MSFALGTVIVRNLSHLTAHIINICILCVCVLTRGHFGPAVGHSHSKQVLTALVYTARIIHFYRIMSFASACVYCPFFIYTWTRGQIDKRAQQQQGGIIKYKIYCSKEIKLCTSFLYITNDHQKDMRCAATRLKHTQFIYSFSFSYTHTNITYI